MNMRNHIQKVIEFKFEQPVLLILPYALVLEYLNNSDELERLETQLKSLLEEKRIFAEKAEKERQFKKMVLQQNIVELAELVLRYNNCIEKVSLFLRKSRDFRSIMLHIERA